MTNPHGQNQPHEGQFQQPYQGQHPQNYPNQPQVQHVVHQHARVPLHQKHGLNILLTVISCGLWGLVWLGLAIYANHGGRGIGIYAGALVALSIAGSALGTNDDTGSTAAEESQQNDAGVVAQPDKPAADDKKGESDDGDKVVPIGKPAHDGKFKFVVKNTACGKTTIGGQYGEKADGVYCIVTVDVTNVGDEAQMFHGSAQTVHDTQGRTFDADSTAGIYLDGSNSFLNDINPGNKVTGKLVFDVPKGAKITTIELHDSMFSGGVTAALR